MLSELQIEDNKTFLHADCEDHISEDLLVQWVKCLIIDAQTGEILSVIPPPS